MDAREALEAIDGFSEEVDMGPNRGRKGRWRCSMGGSSLFFRASPEGCKPEIKTKSGASRGLRVPSTAIKRGRTSMRDEQDGVLDAFPAFLTDHRSVGSVPYGVVRIVGNLR